MAETRFVEQRDEGMSRSRQELLGQLKAATVALAVVDRNADPQPSRDQPFVILGSGFCIHKKGVIVTCAHVVEAFMEKSIKENLDSIPEEQKSKDLQEIPDTRSFIPHALFYVPKPDTQQVAIISSRVEIAMAKTDMDLGLLRLHPHAYFEQGYPTVPIEDFDEIHEGMEIATCGFPLGNKLFEQLGTVTSSFSRGIISSIIPTPGAAREHVQGFQLDLRATHGNSGGPVFDWQSGRVLGVLQGGVDDDCGNHLFSRAESIYRLLDLGAVQELVEKERPREADQ